MKVLALIYGDEASWESASDEERESMIARYRAFGDDADGKIVGGAQLAPTRTATTVRVRDGQTAVPDGPYAETKEQLGGFFVFDCGSADEALALAKQIPGLDHGAAVVVRPAYVEEATA